MEEGRRERGRRGKVEEGRGGGMRVGRRERGRNESGKKGKGEEGRGWRRREGGRQRSREGWGGEERVVLLEGKGGVEVDVNDCPFCQALRVTLG